MFCSYCGKQIALGSRFCSFCGSAVVGAVRNAGAIQPEIERQKTVEPLQTAEPVQPMQTVQPVENPMPIELPEEHDFEEAEASGEAVSEVEEPIAPTLDEQQISLDITTRLPDFPEQNPDFQQQISEPQIKTQEQQAAVNAPEMQIPEQQNTFLTTQNAQNYPVQQSASNQPGNPPERKYTAAHLIMCLASTAIFAIAAGVFAGLYFAGI